MLSREKRRKIEHRRGSIKALVKSGAVSAAEVVEFYGGTGVFIPAQRWLRSRIARTDSRGRVVSPRRLRSMVARRRMGRADLKSRRLAAEARRDPRWGMPRIEEAKG